MRAAAEVLAFGHDPALLQTRCLVLESAGYMVHMASSFPAVARILRSRPIALSILCHTVSWEECEKVIAEAVHGSPVSPVLLLQNGEYGVGTRSNTEIAILNHLDGPRQLIAVADRMTRRSAMVSKETGRADEIRGFLQ